MNLTNSKTANGFVLLEVLVAMALILGVWMSSLSAYQGLVLWFKQQESKRSHLRETFDGYELAEQVRANHSQSKQITSSNTSNISFKGIKNESSRVSSRNRTLHSTAKPAIKNER